MARVLVIDDEEDMRRVVDAMLKNVGHDTAMAVDGTDGLRQFEQQRFDLVICDIFMPNLDGIATLRELRRLDSALPVIICRAARRAPSFGKQRTWITSRWRKGSALLGRSKSHSGTRNSSGRT
jgi:CheY-like chemotaxis protein